MQTPQELVTDEPQELVTDESGMRESEKSERTPGSCLREQERRYHLTRERGKHVEVKCGVKV